MRILIFLLLTNHLVPALAQKPNSRQAVEQTVILFFDALAKQDINTMKSYCTDDLIILEDGLVWNLDTLTYLVQMKKPPDFKRTNKLEFFKTEIHRKSAYTCYFNQAAVTSNGNHFKIRWLESVVAIRTNGRWKIKLLHSTTLSEN